MNERIQKIKQTYGQWQSMRAAEYEDEKRAGAQAKKMRQEHESAVAEFNASMTPTRLDSREDMTRYQESLSGNEIVRPCFVAHNGAPVSYPCLAVSVRTVTQYGDDVTYYHRFVYPADMALFHAQPGVGIINPRGLRSDDL